MNSLKQNKKMTKIKIKLRTSSVPGKPGTIFYQISHKKEVKQITTHIRLLPEQWDAANEQIQPEAIKHISRLTDLQRQIDCYTLRLRRIIATTKRLDGDFNVRKIAERFYDAESTVGVLAYIKEQTARLDADGKQGTAKNLRSTLSSLSDYLGGQDIPFCELNEPLMVHYEEWLMRKGVKRNSSSFYMRNLRSVYNKAVKQGHVRQTEPFRNVYTSIDKTAKRAVDEQVMAELKALNLHRTPSLELARDLFLFSYCTRGMAFVDMAYLQYSDISNNTIHYIRKKTGQPLAIRIEPSVREIMERYRKDTHAGLVLPILHTNNKVDAYRQYQNRLRYYNKLLKKLSELLDGDVSLTSYVSRHSWASVAHKHNVPIAVISDGMGHTSEKTTQIYLASIDEDVINRANAELVALLDNKKIKKKK